MAQTAAPYDHLEELSAQLDALRDEAKALCDDPLRTDARRKLGERLRSLAACARGIPPIAEALHACQVIVRASAVLGRLDAVDRERLMEAVARIEHCAREQEMTPSSGRANARRPNANGVLRVAMLTGSARVEALRAEDWAADDDRSPVLELTRLARVSETRAAVSRDKPDVVVIDADIDGAADCVEKLVSDKATEAIPIVLVGTWRDAGDASSFVVMGVARCLAKPASPSDLRRAVLDVAPGWTRSPFQPIGETTLDRLGARLANELQRGLCDAAADGARTRPVDLGDGAEVLSALWDAVARIRQLVTARARGTIRFATNGPAAALPSAPWLGGSPRIRPDRAATLGEVRRSERTPTLEGHTIVVADDDPSMSWFLSGVLREAGATVVEAFDGEQALDRIYRTIPDLVMSDIVMPEIDGYTLCRAVKRDVALRACPVVLLSWKRDLLQRMRELGADADGYLLKEASAREILQRIQELLSPQRSIARRLLEGGPVRGRLDGMSPFALLRAACQLRPDCRVTVRDAHFVFTIEVRQGRPVSATRTADDGGTERGAPVIIGMLGVGDGRFGVEPIDAEVVVPRELSGTLEDQLKHPIALARAAQQLLRGQRLLGVERVQFDETALLPEVACTPEPARSLLHALFAGASPRSMIASGRASAELLERVLDDAARRGAVRVVMDQHGQDVLLTGFERELAIVEGRGDRSAWREVALSLRSEDAPELWDEIDEAAEPVNNTPSDEVVVVDNRVLDVRTPSPPPPKVQSPRLPAPHATTPLQASAVVSAGARHHTPILSTAVTSPARLAELDPSPVPEAPPIEQRDQTPTERKVQKRRRRRQEESPPAAMVAPELPRAPLLPSAYVTRPREPEPEARRHRWLLPVLFGAAGIALAVGARWMREHRPAPPPPMEEPASEPAAEPRAEKPIEPEAAAPEEPPEELPLSGEDKARLREGQALLEIVVGRQDQVFVDGKDAGRGPVVKLAVDAGEAPHEIRAKLRGEERVRYVTIRPGTRVRVRVAPPWSR